MTDDSESDRPPRRRRGPRKVTATYIENSAAHYLGRFATSSAHLRQVMMQKVHRSAAHHGTSVEEGEGYVDAVIAKFLRLGFLNDTEYAAMRARGLHAKGTPIKGIRFQLKRKGLNDDDITSALEALVEDEDARDLDFAAAIKLARRRRLGPFRTDDPDVRRERRDKDMAALARAGFGYDVAQRIVDADTVEDLEAFSW